MLTPKKSNTYNMRLHLLTLPLSCVTQSCSCNIFWYCSGMLLFLVCLRLSDDKFRENNAIICPASYSCYSTNHNDAAEDYFNQTYNGEFSKHGKISVCICCGFDRPNRVLKQAVCVLIVVQKQHLTSANTM